MTNRKIIWVYYNVDLKQLVDVNGTPISSQYYPEIFYQEYPIVFLTLYKGEAGSTEAYTGLDTTMSFTLVGDVDYDPDTDVLIKSTNLLDVNVAGDWDAADLSQGKLSIRLNANTTTLEDALGTEVYLDGWCEVRGRIVTDVSGTPTLVPVWTHKFPCRFYNCTEHDDSTPSLPPDPLSGYYPISYIDTYLAAKADKPHSAEDHLDLAYDNVASTGLDFHYKEGRVTVGNAVHDIAAGSLAIPAGQAYVIEADQSGVLHATAGSTFTQGRLPLHSVTAGVSALTATDQRAFLHTTPTEAIGSLGGIKAVTFAAASLLTVSSGAVTVTQSTHRVAGEGGASDDLTTINGSVEGGFILLYPSSALQTITLKDGVGNIILPGGLDYALDANEGAMLYQDGSNWRLLNQAPRTGVYRTREVPADQLVAASIDGASATTVSRASGMSLKTLAFAGTGGGSNTDAWLRLQMPDEWDRGELGVKILSETYAGASAGDLYKLSVAAAALGSGDALDATLGSDFSATAALTDWNELNSMTITGVTAAGTPALGDMLVMKVSRDKTYGSLSEDLYVHTVVIQYRELGNGAAEW